MQIADPPGLMILNREGFSGQPSHIHLVRRGLHAWAASLPVGSDGMQLLQAVLHVFILGYAEWIRVIKAGSCRK